MARTIPGYPDPSAHVVEPVGTVAWMSQTWEITSIEVTRSLGAGLPAQVAATDGMVAATATVSMSTEGLVSEGEYMPWESPRPRRGDHMDVYTGLGTASRRVIRGRVDEVHGDLTDPTLEIVVVDRIDQLNRPVEIDPLNFRMPPHYDGGSHRLIGLHPTYLTDRVARACGFRATPQKEVGSWVSAPMVGSVWPEYGNLLFAGTTDPGDGSPWPATPTFYGAPWGLGVTNAQARYQPVQRKNPGPLGLTLKYPTFIRFLVAGPLDVGRNRIILKWSGDHSYHIRITKGQGLVMARFASDVSDSVDVMTGANIFQMPLPAGSDSMSELDVSLWISPVDTSNASSDAAVRAQINSTVQTGLTWASATMKSTSLEEVRVYSAGEDGALGGVQVGSNLSVYDLHAWGPRNAIYETDYSDYWSGVPAITERTGLDLLKEQANKSLGALWIDSEARLRYRSMDRLLNSPISGADLHVDNVEALRWSEGGGSLSEAVKVTWKQPTANRGIYQTAIAWQANAPQIAVGEVYEEVIHPEADVDWIDVAGMVKLPNNNVDPQDATRWSQYMAGIGTWVSAVLQSDDPEVGENGIQHVPISWYSFSFEKIDARSWRIRVLPTAEALIGARVLVLRTAGHGYLPEHKRAVATPLVACRARVQWSELETTGATAGPLDTGRFVHDAGYWVQNLPTAQTIADYISARTAAPAVVFHDIDVQPDDRRELGDTHKLDIGDRPHKVLCVGIKDRITPTERTQTLTVLVIEEI